MKTVIVHSYYSPTTTLFFTIHVPSNDVPMKYLDFENGILKLEIDQSQHTMLSNAWKRSMREVVFLLTDECGNLLGCCKLLSGIHPFNDKEPIRKKLNDDDFPTLPLTASSKEHPKRTSMNWSKIAASFRSGWVADKVTTTSKDKKTLVELDVFCAYRQRIDVQEMQVCANTHFPTLNVENLLAPFMDTVKVHSTSGAIGPVDHHIARFLLWIWEQKVWYDIYPSIANTTTKDFQVQQEEDGKTKYQLTQDTKAIESECEKQFLYLDDEALFSSGIIPHRLASPTYTNPSTQRSPSLSSSSSQCASLILCDSPISTTSFGTVTKKDIVGEKLIGKLNDDISNALNRSASQGELKINETLEESVKEAFRNLMVE
jgi:hypothetical protein